MRVRAPAGGACVVATVNFHDQLPSGSEEVHDAVADDDLAPEPGPQLAARQLCPEQPLRGCGLVAHAAREAVAAGEVR